MAFLGDAPSASMKSARSTSANSTSMRSPAKASVVDRGRDNMYVLQVVFALFLAALKHVRRSWVGQISAGAAGRPARATDPAL
jgi:hypothetical protein